MNYTVPGPHFHPCLPELDRRAVYLWYKLTKKNYTKLSVLLRFLVVSDIVHLAHIPFSFYLCSKSQRPSVALQGSKAALDGQRFLQSVVNAISSDRVSSVLIRHRHQVLINVQLEFRNPRFHISLHRWSTDLERVIIFHQIREAGTIIMIFPTKRSRAADADSPWQWCAVLATWSLRQIPNLCRGQSPSAAAAELEEKEPFRHPAWQMTADAGGQLGGCARDREIGQIRAHGRM